jgi:hypothetical protein
MAGRTWVVEMLFDSGRGISEARSRMNWLTADVEYPVIAQGRQVWVGICGTVIDE